MVGTEARALTVFIQGQLLEMILFLHHRKENTRKSIQMQQVFDVVFEKHFFSSKSNWPFEFICGYAYSVRNIF